MPQSGNVSRQKFLEGTVAKAVEVMTMIIPSRMLKRDR
ncbi:hypothetical protein AM1_2212 [Acaryochloris marina MBIC11017]|uniref:Uncharacterized protein n=1 Tax=Acaryochloris marina (strain MBIC 11017) TaxID=329726 RepID=B0C0W6_ACAM1|nr:hypothetical protein AM1_2212 [Acaryochloris marina MBIC11017]